MPPIDASGVVFGPLEVLLPQAADTKRPADVSA
jgi:hypothetical protein